MFCGLFVEVFGQNFAAAGFDNNPITAPNLCGRGNHERVALAIQWLHGVAVDLECVYIVMVFALAGEIDGVPTITGWCAVLIEKSIISGLREANDGDLIDVLDVLIIVDRDEGNEIRHGCAGDG